MAKETWPNVKQLVENHYSERQNAIKDTNEKYGCNLQCYDIHDGKMLYLLTQHSAWNRRHHPFILCKCKKGQYWGKTRQRCN